MTQLTALPWWKASAIRALRTALVVAIPYVPASYFGSVPYLALFSAAGLGFVLSIFTSLAGIAEVDGNMQPWWYAILSRVVKTIAQALTAGVGTAVLLQDVDWNFLLQTSITAGFGSLLLAFLMQLPEADKPVAVVSVSTFNINAAGQAFEQSIPVVATVIASSPDVVDDAVPVQTRDLS